MGESVDSTAIGEDGAPPANDEFAPPPASALDSSLSFSASGRSTFGVTPAPAPPAAPAPEPPIVPVMPDVSPPVSPSPPPAIPPPPPFSAPEGPETMPIPSPPVVVPSPAPEAALPQSTLGDSWVAETTVRKLRESRGRSYKVPVIAIVVVLALAAGGFSYVSWVRPKLLDAKRTSFVMGWVKGQRSRYHIVMALTGRIVRDGHGLKIDERLAM